MSEKKAESPEQPYHEGIRFVKTFIVSFFAAIQAREIN
jgi:hypothetical protein